MKLNAYEKQLVSEYKILQATKAIMERNQISQEEAENVIAEYYQTNPAFPAKILDLYPRNDGDLFVVVDRGKTLQICKLIAIDDVGKDCKNPDPETYINKLLLKLNVKYSFGKE